jgi:hypothetical protein
MLKFLSFMSHTFKIHPFPLANYLGTSLIIGNLMRISVTSVEWHGWVSVALCPICCLIILITELESNIDELANASSETNYAQDFDLTIDLDPIDVDNVAPPTVKLSHASSLSSFLLENSLYFGVNETIRFQKLVRNSS